MKKLSVLILFSIFTISLSLKAEEQRTDTNFLKGFYITGGISQSLTDTKLKSDLSLYLPNHIQSSNTLLNFGVGYDINKYFAVEFNYKQGMARTHNPNTLILIEDYEDGSSNSELIHKNYTNKSNNYIAYLVAKLPLSVQHITPFIKLGLGYSQYNTKTSSFIYTEYYRASIDSSDMWMESDNIKTKLNSLSYHMQIGTEINLNSNNVISVHYGFDTLSAKPKVNGTSNMIASPYPEEIGKSDFKFTESKHSIFDNQIGINYTYRF
ncbi:MAG: porin family protein [Alphaproteobacteria bacterium]|jgi:hypothetical protein|nr:porin family protein [Alphaproteobacteria bacterium]